MLVQSKYAAICLPSMIHDALIDLFPYRAVAAAAHQPFMKQRHIGLHWQMTLGMARKTFGPCALQARWLIRAAGVFIALYGLSAFIRHQFLIYLSLSSSFVFFDHTQPAVLFFVDHAAIMGMFVFLAHYGSKALSRRK